MSVVAVAIIVSGVLVAGALGFAAGFDPVGIVIFSFILLFAALGLAAVAKFRSRSVSPVPCRGCGKAISPNAPFCKHCGASV